MYQTKSWQKILAAILSLTILVSSYAPAFAESAANAPDVPQRAPEMFWESGIQPYSGYYEYEIQDARNRPLYVYEQDGYLRIVPSAALLAGGPVMLEYRIGEEGEWMPYRDPVEIPRASGTYVYARSDRMPEALWTVKLDGATGLYGEYHEQDTDLSMSAGNVTFDFSRTYDREDADRWFFSVESEIRPYSTYCVRSGLSWYLLYEYPLIRQVILPDKTELMLIAEAEGRPFTDSTGDWTLTYEDGTGTLTYRNELTYTYGTDSLLSRIEDNNGNAVSFVRTETAVTVSDSYGRSYTLALEDGKPVSLTDPLNRVTAYAYNSGGYLSSVTDPSGVVTGSYTYSDGLLSKSNDTSIYYSDVFVTSLESDNGSRVTYTYDNAAQRITLTDTAGNTTVYSFSNRLLASSVDEVSYTYDSLGRITTVTQNGKTNVYSYNDDGDVSSIVTPEGSIEYRYENRRVTREKDADGGYTYYAYDSKGNVTVTAELIDSSGSIPEAYMPENASLFHTITYTRRADGLVTKEENSELNSVTSYTYDDYGSIISTSIVKTQEDNTTDTAQSAAVYDMTGRLLSSTENGETTSYFYDAAGRTLRVQCGAQTTRSLYDSSGRLVQEIGPKQYEASKDGLPSENTYEDASAGTRYVYAANGNLISQTNPYGQTTTYTYDSTGNMTASNLDLYHFDLRKTGAASAVTVNGAPLVSYSYTGGGQKEKLTGETWANGQTVSYVYNDEEQMTGIRYNDMVENAYTFSYNEEGEISEVSDGLSGLRTVYGEDDRVDQYAGDSTSPYHSYDTDGETLKETVFGAELWTNTRNGIESLRAGDAGTYHNMRQMDAQERIEMRRVVHGWTWNGTPSPAAMYSAYYAYDGNNLQSISYSNNINQVYSYEYTDDGKIASETIGKYDTGETTEFHGYTYDAYGQLTEEVNSSLFGAGYAYDDRGNLVSVQKQTAGGTETRVFTYGNPAWPDQLTAVNGSPLTYDAAGNRTSYNGWSYSWRAGRQLANMSNGTTSIQFQYDSDGIRTQKTVNGITTQYTTLDGRITGQSDGTTVMQFIYTEEGAPFGMMVNGEPYLYVTNLQGDVTMVTDRSGLPLCSYTYDAWGNVLSITGEDTEIGELNPIRYRGYYQDVETGLYYLQSRYYDSTTMRFINADDPSVIQMGSEEKQELNLYVYCVNDPVNHVDPTGYIAANVIGAIIGGVIGAVGGYFLTNWLADRLGLKGWGRNLFVWGLSALIGATAAAIGYFIGPYVAKAWSAWSAKLSGLIKGTFKNIAKITSQKMGHINVSKHFWNKVMKKVTTTQIETLIYQGIRKGTWNLLSNGSVKILYKYGGQTIVITGNVVERIFKVGNAWVWNGIGKP